MARLRTPISARRSTSNHRHRLGVARPTHLADCARNLPEVTKRLIAVSSGSVLAWRVREATTFLQRSRGLLGAPRLAPGECLLMTGGAGLRMGASVHTFGMTYPIDVLFCDSRWTVIHRITAMPPNTSSRWVFRARHIVELPVGTVDQRLCKGERLRVLP